MLSRKTILSCFIRSYFIGGAFNFRGLQNLGLLYAIDPALREIYQDEQALCEARMRYMWHFNTHPLWVPVLLGLFINLEQSVSRDALPSQGMVALKNTACYTLSGIGDSVFSGSLIPLWGLGMCCLAVCGFYEFALLFMLTAVAGVQIFRLATFMAGLRHGLGVIEKLRRYDIMQWGHKIKILNGCLLALLIYLIIPAPASKSGLLLLTMVLSAGGWLLFQGKFARFTVAVFVLVTFWGGELNNWL
ncbi:MAG: PTS system mannose/fructose/sorbose family transporter subunit IID [Desulfovibrionaceae bacterium]|nr:PTS system mannose/fructose/sorbose family transporter subunit IID [Desulfovibrionaceae bacterium]